MSVHCSFVLKVQSLKYALKPHEYFRSPKGDSFAGIVVIWGGFTRALKSRCQSVFLVSGLVSEPTGQVQKAGKSIT